MPKLPRLTSKQLIKILEAIGFIVDRQRGSHLVLRDKQGRVAVVANHPGTMPIGTLKATLRDIGITPEDIINLL